MRVKDYYKILEVAPGATEADIKRSFRKLALRFHPDTNDGNKYSEAWFRELQEAYAVLTDPDKKENYLQERWLAQSLGQPLEKIVPLTPNTVALEALQVSKSVMEMDHFRMDHRALAGKLLGVLTDEKIHMLQAFNDKQATREVATQMLQASAPLDYKYLPDFFRQMQKLCASDAAFSATLEHTKRQRQQAYWWERNQWWVMLAGTFLLCAIIYLISE
jgi:curved DNA-binding protein CbpA